MLQDDEPGWYWRWVTVCRCNILLCNQPLRPTQPPTLRETGYQCWQKCVMFCAWEVKAGMIRFHPWMHVWVTGKTVWSIFHTCHTWAPRDKQCMQMSYLFTNKSTKHKCTYKHYTLSSVRACFCMQRVISRETGSDTRQSIMRVQLTWASQWRAVWQIYHGSTNQ